MCKNSSNYMYNLTQALPEHGCICLPIPELQYMFIFYIQNNECDKDTRSH